MSLSRGLVGHWSLDEESYNPATKRFTDKSAYNNHGTSANAASFVADRMGQADRAMSFNGSSDCVDCGSGDSLTVEDLTVSLWAKTNDTHIGRVLVSKYYKCWEVAIWSTDKVAFYKSNGWGGHETFHQDIGWTHGTYHHLVCTFSATSKELNVYLDGNFAFLHVFNSSSLSNPVNYNVVVGQRTGGSYPMNGAIDNVRIYNRVLTQAEITLLYESYRPKTIIV